MEVLLKLLDLGLISRVEFKNLYAATNPHTVKFHLSGICKTGGHPCSVQIRNFKCPPSIVVTAVRMSVTNFDSVNLCTSKEHFHTDFRIGTYVD